MHANAFFVQEKPRRGMGFIGGCFLVCGIFLLLGIVVPMGIISTRPGRDPSSGPSPREQVREQLQVVDWKWHTPGFGTVMVADFTISNGSPYDVKDVAIRFTEYGNSGTEVGTGTKTIYEVFKEGEVRGFRDFRMGFVHSQAATCGARIRTFEIVGE